MAIRPVLLTVEDDPAVGRAVARDLRRRYGQTHRMVRADSGPAALAALRELTVRGEATAIVLADYRMPGMNGVEFLEQAMDIVPAAKRVLLTAYADTDAAIRAINEVDLDHYLLKPWDPPEERLYPVLDELIEQWSRTARPGFDGATLLGHQWSAQTQELKEFLARNQVPYRHLREAEDGPIRQAAGLDEADLPAVVLPDGQVLRQPSLRELAEQCGLATTADNQLYDVVVVGAGPAGLGAAVYAASEGLRTLLVERAAVGGQAGQSSLIENYLGFPRGVSGTDLAQRARDQAVRFSVEALTAAEDELRTLFLFEHLTEEQLAWLAARAEVRAFDAGAAVYRVGEVSDALWILLDGELRLSRPAPGGDVTISETSQRGVYAGAVQAFADSAAEHYETSLVATRPSRFLRIPADDFATFMHRWFPLAVHLLDGLYMGIQTSQATIRQREHLAKLGHLAANLAHELNNPAAAAVRSTAQLRTRIAGMRHKLGMIAEKPMDRALLTQLIALQEAAVERAAKQRTPLTSMQESDLEEELADRLDELAVPEPYDPAPVFAAAGLDLAWLDEVTSAVGEHARDGALRWLAYTLETEALMDELEDASTRISTLVAAVRQYSYLDQAAHQEVDLHPGLDSTVVMLGHKLHGVEVRREYDRDLPAVPAYASELNQVWTNLIDNAADAMDGRGVLRLRTFRDGEWAVVEVGDDGHGVPEEVRERIFEPLVTTKPAGLGSGLGLDNARRIVEQRHRGSLSFTTGPGGTTFTTRLPLDAAPVAATSTEDVDNEAEQ